MKMLERVQGDGGGDTQRAYEDAAWMRFRMRM